MRSFKYIFKKIIAPNKGLCALTIFLVVLLSGLQLYLPILFQKFIDAIAGKSEVSLKVYILTMYLVLSVAIYIVSLGKDWGAGMAAWKGTDGLRKEILEKILTYDQRFFQERSAGQIIESLENDLNELENFIQNTLIPILINMISMIGIVVVFWRENKGIALYFSFFIMIAFYIIYIQQKQDSDIILKERKSHSEVISFESEIIENRKVIELAGKRDKVLQRLEEKISKRIPLKVALQKYYYRVWIITLSLLAGVNILSLFLGGVLYFNHRISLGMVYLMYSYGNMLKQPFEELQMHIQNFLAAKGSCDKLADLLFYESSVTDGSIRKWDSFSDLVLEDVCFAYGDKLVLNNVNMQISRGKRIGIFGQSGAGKSTISKLLCKILEPQEGKILMNGNDIRMYSIEAIRNAFAYVAAGNLVFAASLRANLTIYNEKISDEEILNVLERMELVKYFTFMKGKNGKELLDMDIDRQMVSNGEAQLLNLCRLFFVEKQMIIFDEASAMIDEEIEEAFNEIFRKLTKNVTTIIITHNVERLKDCDYIYSMNKGKVVEEGEPEELKLREHSQFSQYGERIWQL